MGFQRNRLHVVLAMCLTAVPVATQAQTTALYVDSESGDYIGQGLRQTWTAGMLDFTATISSDRSHVAVSARDAAFTTRWLLNFAAPSGVSLAPGVYENASRYPFQPSVSPGLSVSGSWGGCNTVVGRFVIHEITVGTAGVTSFAADFEQHCEDATPALFGAVRFHSSRSSLLPFDGAYPVYALHVDPAVHGYVTGPGIDCGAGRPTCDATYGRNTSVALQAVPLPGYIFLGWAGLDCAGGDNVALTITRRKFCTPVFNSAPGSGSPDSPDYSQGALFLDGTLPAGGSSFSGSRSRQVFLALPAGSTTGSEISVEGATTAAVSLDVLGPGGMSWKVGFAAPPGSLLTPGSYLYAVAPSYDRGNVPLLALIGSSTWCGDGGRFDIHEIVFTGTVLTRFSADFEMPCGNGGALATGSIRYWSTRVSLLPFDGSYPLRAIEIVPSAGGYVTAAGIDCGDGGRTDCRETYASASNVGLTANPSPGYQFLAWGGSCTGGGPITTVLANRARRCYAVFTPGPGSISPPDPSLGTGTLFVDFEGTAPMTRVWMGEETGVRVSNFSGGTDIVLAFGTSATADSSVRFRAASGRIVPGEYERSADYWPRSGSAFDYAGCSASSFRFRVYEATFDTGGGLLAFAADFEAICGYQSTYLVGAVRYHSSRAAVLPFDGAYPLRKLSIEPAVNGIVTGSGIDCGPGRGDCEEVYGSATSVVLRATPSPGFRFVGWTGACDGGPITVIAVNWIRGCSAVFNPILPGRGPEDIRTRNSALVIESEPGDPVGGGRRHVWLDGEFFAYSFSRYEARITIRLPEGYWYVNLRVPTDADLVPGRYENAGYFDSSSPGSPGIFVDNGNACRSSVTGRFVVYEITRQSPGSATLSSFAADFEQRCVAGGPALRGSIRFNSSRSELRPFPPTPVLGARNDFNADGRLDLVWQNRADGRLGAWFMAGATQIDNAPVVPDQVSDANWHIVGTADANRDGRSDLYWQHQTTGALAVWFMYETARISAEPLAPALVADTRWKIRTVADMDQDGWPDLIWQHTGSGAIAVWFMNGRQLRSAENLSPRAVADVNWTIVGAGDVDRDGAIDLIWHHATGGHLAVWRMRGRVLASAESLSPARVVDVSWRVRGVGDLDGNGTPDLIWQNTATLQVAAWLLNGLRSVSAVPIVGPPLPSASWHLVGPR
jgi:hypothetical protein